MKTIKLTDMNKNSVNEVEEPTKGNRWAMVCKVRKAIKKATEEGAKGANDGVRVSGKENKPCESKSQLPKKKSSHVVKKKGCVSNNKKRVDAEVKDNYDSGDKADNEQEDSDDPSEVEVPAKGQNEPYVDFFEGDALFYPVTMAKHAIFTPYEEILDYKQMFLNVRKIVEDVPNEFKYDISTLLYPMLALVYLRMVVGGNRKMAQEFLEANEDCLEDVYGRSISKLRRIRRPHQVPDRALEMLFDDELVLLEMPKATRLRLCEYIANTQWTLAQQKLFLRHIVIDGYDEFTPKRRRPPLARPPIEKISWADLTNSARDNLHLEPRNEVLNSCFLSPAQFCETEEVICTSVFKDGCWLGMATADFSVRLLSGSLNEPTKELTIFSGHTGKVYAGDISPDRRFLISCSQDGTMRLWCLVLRKCVGIYNQSSPVRSVVFAPVGDYFATGSEDGRARVWMKGCTDPMLQISGHLAELGVCVYHPNSRYLATGSADLTVRMWDLVKNGEQVRLFNAHKEAITALAFSKSGRYLISGALDCAFIIWDTINEMGLRSLIHHQAPISTIDFSIDDSRLAVGCRDTYLSIWNFDNILKRDQTRDQVLILSHSNPAGPIFKSRFVDPGLLITICNKPKNIKKNKK